MGVAGRAGVALDGDHPVRADAVGEEGREQPDAGVQVEHPLPRLGREEVEHGLHEHRRRAGVHLPEAVGGHGEGVRRSPGGDALGHRRLLGPGHRDQAVVDGHQLVGPVPAHRATAVGQVGEPRARAPPQAGLVAGDPLHDDGHVEARQPAQLLGDHVGLELALPAQRHVLEVAAPAQSRPGDRARRRHPVGGGRQHVDGVGPPELVAVRPLGDHDLDPFPGDRVPHEDHAARVVAVREPGHAVPAVGHRTRPRR